MQNRNRPAREPASAPRREPASGDIPWPEVSSACRPWTRWWWMGSAVDEAEITHQLQLFQQAGFGGVEVSPIYGVEGEEERAIPFLSRPWIRMLSHTLREAQRLGMGVDMITGTGWPLGGPWVGVDDAAARLVLESHSVAAGSRFEQPLGGNAPQAAVQAVMAFGADGQVLDLLDHVDRNGRLDWTAPGGQWRVYAVLQAPTGQQVKRAAPGGEGNVVDHFSARGIARYLDPFDRAFADLPAEEQVRCLFNDSYEVYEANWTAELLAEFQRRRGYDLRRHLPALAGDEAPETVSRVRSDYRQTIADLLLDAFVRPWTAWAHRRGALARNQAHGAPGNLLDLYAAADIPETETFGPDWLRLAGMAPLPGTPPEQGGRASVLVGKVASSAAHVAGKQLCSSESFTWLGEHGKVPLSHMKAELDVAFVMGINHVFFHGTPFSPASAAWPGWIFYAATHVGPSAPFWRDLPALNAYISRCQSVLQAGRPDNDVLLYLPIFDLWATDRGAEHLLHFLTVHSEHWLDEDLPAFTAAARRLWDRGFGFDFISDQLLDQAIEVAGQQLQAHGCRYQVLAIAGCTLMPPETMERILDLMRAGATVLCVGELPMDVPGLGDRAARRRRLEDALAQLGPLETIAPGVAVAGVGRGRLLLGSDLEDLLRVAGVRREQIVDSGIELVRRRDDGGYLYFMANLGDRRLDRWTNLPIEAASVAIMEPAGGRHGMARIKKGDGPETLVYLQLEPGETILLRGFDQAADGPPWTYFSPAGRPLAVEGEWRVDFVAGGPTLPRSAAFRHLASWTEWPGDSDALRAFSGTARYTITFHRPAVAADAWAIDLGTVFHSARVRLDGRDLGTVYARPFRVQVADSLGEGEHQLEVEVTNLMANRLADLDRRKQPWRQFFFVNIQYQAFDASSWEPLPSGLLGPVQLVPLRRLNEL